VTTRTLRSRRRTRQEPTARQRYGIAGWGALFALAFLAGGLAVGELTHESLGWAVGISLPIAAGAFAALASGVLGDSTEVNGSYRRLSLSEFLGLAKMAQCPRCGSFRIDARTPAAVWQFWCLDCDDQWAWLPGNPWPTLQMRRGLRGPLSMLNGHRDSRLPLCSGRAWQHRITAWPGGLRWSGVALLVLILTRAGAGAHSAAELLSRKSAATSRPATP